MRTSSPDGRPAGHVRVVAMAGAFLCAALMLSLAESFIFPAGILPIPGAKPGLANAAVMLCACMMGRRYACGVSFARIMLMFFLFGSATSVIYSLAGAALSFAGIALFCQSERLSFLGKSVIAAVLHNVAQAVCAMLILGFPAVMLLPWMILSGVLCGGITGVILNLVYSPICRALPNLSGGGCV